MTMSLDQCREKCWSNCSCMAYTNSDMRGQGSGCVMWFGDLIDIRQHSEGGQNLYVRMAASDLEITVQNGKKLIIIAAFVVIAICGVLFCLYARLRSKINDKSKRNNEVLLDDLELPLMDLPVIVAATANFSVKNKIGEGGFGPVYKGTLINGQEFAMKKLSRSSGQGTTEFKNEVKLIARL